MWRRGLVTVGCAALFGCSFTTASGFDECATDADCGAGAVCTERVCLPLPEGCAGVTGAFDKADRIPFVALLPKSIPMADGSVGVDNSEVQGLNAMALALEEANRFDGLGGRLFALYACDTFDDNERGAAQAGWAVKNLKAPGLITSGSGLTQNVAHQADRQAEKTFIISHTATSASLVALFESDGNVWRVPPDDGQQARVLANQVVLATTGASRKVVIAYEDSVYGAAFEPELRKALAERSRETESKPFTRGLDGAAAMTLVNKIANESPAATVLIAFPTDVVAIVTAAASNDKLNGTTTAHRWFLSDAAKDPAILTPATAPLLTGATPAIGTAPAQGAGTAFPTFRGAFQTRFGIDPTSYAFTSHAYDATWLTLVATAWASGGGAITGDGLREGMTWLSDTQKPPTALLGANWSKLSGDLANDDLVNVDGSSGALDFDTAKGTPSSPYEVWVVTGSGIVTDSIVNP